MTPACDIPVEENTLSDMACGDKAIDSVCVTTLTSATFSTPKSPIVSCPVIKPITTSVTSVKPVTSSFTSPVQPMTTSFTSPVGNPKKSVFKSNVSSPHGFPVLSIAEGEDSQDTNDKPSYMSFIDGVDKLESSSTPITSRTLGITSVFSGNTVPPSSNMETKMAGSRGKSLHIAPIPNITFTVPVRKSTRSSRTVNSQDQTNADKQGEDKQVNNYLKYDQAKIENTFVFFSIVLWFFVQNL